MASDGRQSATIDGTMLPPLDGGVLVAQAEVAALMGELEPTLTDRQCSLLHQIRLVAEALGAARAALLTRCRPS